MSKEHCSCVWDNWSTLLLGNDRVNQNFGLFQVSTNWQYSHQRVRKGWRKCYLILFLTSLSHLWRQELKYHQLWDYHIFSVSITFQLQKKYELSLAGWCGSVPWTSSHAPKVQVQFQVRTYTHVTDLIPSLVHTGGKEKVADWCFSHTLMLFSLSLSLKKSIKTI